MWHRDRNPDRFKRPDFLDRPPFWSRRGGRGLHVPDWWERRRQRSKDPDRFSHPGWADRSTRDRNPNRLSRPDWLDRIRDRDIDPDRFALPEIGNEPRRARRNPDRLKRPDVLDRPGGVPRRAKLLGVATLVVVLVGAVVAVWAVRGGGHDGGPAGRAGGRAPVVTVSLSDHSMVPRRIAGLPTPATAVAIRRDDQRLFVAEGDGQLWVSGAGVGAPPLAPWLDLRSDPAWNPQDEVLGMAVSADGSQLFVSFSDQPAQQFVVVAFAATADRGDATTRREVLRFAVPGPSFVGGDLAIGPDDLLYVSVGDGAEPTDLAGTGRSQDLTELAGKILRIDPTPGPGGPYTVPPDNPFVGSPTARPEIWAYGVHEATGLSWSTTGELWFADRGAARQDEIDVLPGPAAGRGADLGWDLAEGDLRYKGVPSATSVRPLVSIPTSDSGCQTVGGTFYEDPSVVGRGGAYLYSDGCDDAVRAVLVGPDRRSNRVVSATFLSNEQVQLVSGGGSLGPVALGTAGGVFRLVPSSVTPSPLSVAIDPPSPSPPSSVQDLCGISDAFAILNPTALADRSPEIARMILDRVRTALADYRAVAPPSITGAIDQLIASVDSIAGSMRDLGYSAGQDQLAGLQSQLADSVLHQDGTGPLADVVQFEDQVCPGPKLIDLGTRSSAEPTSPSRRGRRHRCHLCRTAARVLRGLGPDRPDGVRASAPAAQPPRRRAVQVRHPLRLRRIRRRLHPCPLPTRSGRPAIHRLERVRPRPGRVRGPRRRARLVTERRSPAVVPGTTVVGPALLVAIALVALVRGDRTTAIVICAAALFLLHALLLSASFRRIATSAQHRVGTVAATVVRVVLLTPVGLVLLTPASALRRLVHGPAHRSEREASTWVSRDRPPPSDPGRRWADERSWRPAVTPRRRRTIVATVLAVVAVEALLVGAVVVIHRRSQPRPRLVGTAAIGNQQTAALRDLPWVPEAERETGEVSRGIVSTPFTGLSIRDYHGRYVNVQNRVRRSYQAPAPPGVKPIDVWFFGGSTMFGFDLQRDEHTIASEVVRLAEADGLVVRARNYGSTGYVNYQESILFGLLLGGGQRPDLAVFYDGVNDESLAFLDASGGFDPPGEPSYLGSFEARQALAARPLGDNGPAPPRTDLPPSPLRPATTAEPLAASALERSIQDVYRQGFDLSQALAARYGTQVVHFWQPEIYTRSPLDPGERVLLPGLGLDPFRYDTIRALLDRVRSGLPSGVIDISASLDDVHGPVFSDSAHINEKGARAVAEAIYARLKPQLVALAGSR